MTLKEFFIKYHGKKVDFDGAYGAQCVDLARQYFKDVFQLPRQPEGVVGAQDFFLKHESRPVQKQLLHCTAYDGTASPPAGSVVVFKATPSNRFGHIGICLKPHKESVEIFEQDGFKQDGAKITLWKYDNLLGWLTRREEPALPAGSKAA